MVLRSLYSIGHKAIPVGMLGQCHTLPVTMSATMLPLWPLPELSLQADIAMMA